MTHIEYSDCYKKVYNEIILDPLYDKIFFETYDEFLLFCEKNYTGLQELFMCRQIKLQKIISNKITTNILKKDYGNNEPITYLKFVYRRL